MKTSLVFFFAQVLLYSSTAYTQICDNSSRNDLLRPACLDIVHERIDELCDPSRSRFSLANPSDHSDYNALYEDYVNLAYSSPFTEANGFALNNSYKNFNLEKFEEKLAELGYLEPLLNVEGIFEEYSLMVGNTLDEILKEIKKTRAYKESLIRVNNSYRETLDTFEGAMNGEWSFQLEINDESGVNDILSHLASSPLSESSARSLRHTLNSFSNSGIKVRDMTPNNYSLFDFNGFYTPYFLRSFFGIPVLSPVKSINLDHTLVIHNTNPSNQFFLDFVIAHELAHSYTARVDGLGRSLSNTTMSNIQENLAACLYGDVDSERVTTEDTADMLAAKLLERRYASMTMDNINSLASSFCSMPDELSEDTGHNTRYQRLYNIVKYIPQMQELFGCHIPENVCTINFSE